MNGIVFKNVSKIYPKSSQPAVRDVSLELPAGKITVILGPSGCGKTTLLKMVNLLCEPTHGQIFINGKDVHEFKVTQLRRSIGYVIQQSGLFPHMTVEENIAVVPGLLGWDKKRIRERTDFLLEMVNLKPDQYRKRFPRQLSGGQQQRVGLARAMAADPDILLMDEPFGAIDAITRTRLQEELLKIQKQLHKTILFVTHDVEEALRLADVIVIMRDGEVVQYGTPLEIIASPANDMVSELVGSHDIIRYLNAIKVDAVMKPGSAPVTDAVGVRFLHYKDDLKTAVSLMLRTGSDTLAVVDDGQRVIGNIDWERIREIGRSCNAGLNGDR